MGYTLARLNDHDVIRAFLERDRIYAAYALGDLDPPYSKQAEWFGAFQGNDLTGIALIYRGLDPAVLFLMGKRPAIEMLLTIEDAPERVTFLAPDGLDDLVARRFAASHAAAMLRMYVTPETFALAANSQGSPQPEYLPASKASELWHLLETAARHDGRALEDVAFDPGMLDSGYTYGVWESDQLVAAAGTHLVSPSSHLAAVGNVVTHPMWRRRGLATAACGAVTVALIEDGFDLVVLNVRQDNAPAIRVYERLGYRAWAPFIEGIGAWNSTD